MNKISLIFSFLVCISTLSLSKGSFAQNVGIGTSTPAYKLDVKNGSINTDSLYRISSFPVLSIVGNGNLFVGKQAGLVNTGNFNTFAGHSTGIANTSGSYNTFFGTQAGFVNTVGSSNSFFGLNSGAGNVNGFDNSFFGREAGGGNTSGSSNCFFGRNAGAFNSTGFSNVAVGTGALFHNIEGTNSVAIGDSALFNYENFYRNNVAVGSKALFANVNGFSNTAIGYEALFQNTNGSDNSALGTGALLNNTTGPRNVAIGVSSLENSTGFNNVGVGAYSDILGSNSTVLGSYAYVDGNFQYATAVGSSAKVSCSNCLALGGNDAAHRTKVGINIAAPATDLHIIQQSNANFDNSRGIRLQSPNGNHWRVFLDPGNNYVFQYSTGLFSYIEPVGGTFISNSDLRLKTNIADLDGVLDKLLQLQPKSYQYIATSEAGRRSYGFIAQEVEILFPDFVFSSEDGIKGIAYSNFSVIAVKAIQEQQVQIQEQQEQINKLEKKNLEQQQQLINLLQRIEALEKKTP